VVSCHVALEKGKKRKKQAYLYAAAVVVIVICLGHLQLQVLSPLLLSSVGSCSRSVVGVSVRWGWLPSLLLVVMWWLHVVACRG
jgi:hypothetical protein